MLPFFFILVATTVVDIFTVATLYFATTSHAAVVSLAFLLLQKSSYIGAKCVVVLLSLSSNYFNVKGMNMSVAHMCVSAS